MENLSHIPNRSPRPILAHKSIRPPSSVFHRSSIVSIALQAVIHVSTMIIGVHEAKQYDRGAKKKAGFRIRFRPVITGTDKSGIPSPLSLFMENMLPSSNFSLMTQQGEGNDSAPPGSLLGRPPFRPNSVSNVVFLFSIFRSVVIAMVNHRGFPFYMSISEFPDLSAMMNKTMVFVIMCICETVPSVIRARLGLMPWPNKRIKFVMLSLLMANMVGCLLIDDLCMYIWHRELWKERHSTKRGQRASTKTQSLATEVTTVAEEEEQMLQKERERSMKVLVRCCVFVTGTVIHTLLKEANNEKEAHKTLEWLSFLLLLRL